LCVRYPGILIVTEAIRMKDFEHIPSFSATILAEQGKLRLVRLQRRR
jgi:hypothetical protein